MDQTRDRGDERHGERPRRERRPQQEIPGMGDQPALSRPRESRPEHRGEPRGETRSEARAEPRRESRDEQRREQGQRSAQPQQQRRDIPQQQPRRDDGRRSAGRQRDADGGSGGFADNVPAFLRRPVRPTKVAASE
jgi:hypothetical protein